jgi:predicted nucleic-acid-binding protein
VRAVDTNVLARFFIDDPDDPQARRQRLVATRWMQETVFVTVTVLLEFESVMRGFYELTRADTSRVLKALCGLENVSVEDREGVLSAIEWHERGMDFADALHLGRSRRCEALVTFDRRLAKRATRLRAIPAVEVAR